MKLFISTHDWLRLDRDTRYKLHMHFKFPKSGVPEILNNSIISDGFTTKDLMNMNIGIMLDYLNLKEVAPVEGELCDYLFSKVIEKINGRTSEEPISIGGLEEEVKPARRGRPKKEKSNL